MAVIANEVYVYKPCIMTIMIYQFIFYELSYSFCKTLRQILTKWYQSHADQILTITNINFTSFFSV
ncbi:hypothetical protein HanRHA438_Chr16g0762381 [Helianthus annuus]|nr:hypothetical protein HanRHA438_Chr16g0762381 [Helianthus annuus]